MTNETGQNHVEVICFMRIKMNVDFNTVNAYGVNTRLKKRPSL